MGLVVKHRKKYLSKKKRWDKKTILDEKAIVRDYAVGNKTELRRAEFLISKYKNIAKDLNKNADSKKSEEAKHLIEKLKAQGLLKPEASTLEDILDMKLRDVLERRLSNIVYRMKLARTAKQARQFVVHGHVKVAGNLVTAPSYSVSLAEEQTIEFRPTSVLMDENHPARTLVVHGLKEEMEEQSKIPLKTAAPNMDQAEAAMDDEEVPEKVE